MITSIRYAALASALALALPFTVAHAASLTYHGTLQDAGKPAEGKYDIELTIYSTQNGGSAVAGPLVLYGVPVHAGSFSTDADFGPRTDGLSQAWVGVKVRATGSTDFAALDQRSAASIDATTGTCSAWALDGNAGNPSGSYLGTADDQPLLLKANGITLGTFVGGDRADSVALGLGTSAPGYADFAAGDGTVASGPAATAMGAGSVASGHVSFAAGDNATASHDGSFVWADDSTDSGFGDTADHQFLIRATGGVGIGTSTPQAQLDVSSSTTSAIKGRTSGGATAVSGTSQSGNGVYGATFSAAAAAAGVAAINGAGGTALFVETDGGTPAKMINTSSGAYLSGGGTWTNAAGRNLKSGFTPIDVASVLSKVISLPVTEWSYKSEGDSVKHVGPIAQDFKAAFELGNDDVSISTVDEEGIALAAIQGLNKKIEDQNAALRAQNATLITTLDQLAARVTRFEVAQGEMHAAKIEVAQQGD